MDRLHELFRTMDVPASRREDYRWLVRNLGINNQGHPDLEEAYKLVMKRLKKSARKG